MALSEISIIQDALGDDVPLDIIKEIAQFLRYDRYNLHDIPKDGVTRIFALNMKLISTNIEGYRRDVLHADEVQVTRVDHKFAHEFNFKFTINKVPRELACGIIDSVQTYICFRGSKYASKGFVRLLSYKFE